MSRPGRTTVIWTLVAALFLVNGVLLVVALRRVDSLTVAAVPAPAVAASPSSGVCGTDGLCSPALIPPPASHTTTGIPAVIDQVLQAIPQLLPGVLQADQGSRLASSPVSERRPSSLTAAAPRLGTAPTSGPRGSPAPTATAAPAATPAPATSTSVTATPAPKPLASPAPGPSTSPGPAPKPTPKPKPSPS